MTTRPIGAAILRACSSADARVLFAYVAIAFTLFVATAINVQFLSFVPVPAHGFPDIPWFEGWTRWDSDWYWAIARNGYYYAGPDMASPVAFFPAYPLAMRAVAVLVGEELRAGVLVTLASGAAAMVLFRRWYLTVVGRRGAAIAVALLMTAPFAFYLYGAVYSDALFLAAAVGAFLLLERDRMVLAGIVGAVATAARPVGIAVIVALVIRALEKRGVFERGSLLARARRVRPRDTGVLLSIGGIGAFAVHLWLKFDEPLAFAKVGGAPGWERELTWDAFWKRDLIGLFERPAFSPAHTAMAVQTLLTVLALGLTFVVWRRMGAGYAAYNVVVVGFPAMMSKDLIGMGRYALAAFPAYAAAGMLLTRAGGRVGVVATALVLVANAAALVVMHSYFVRWYFFS